MCVCHQPRTLIATAWQITNVNIVMTGVMATTMRLTRDATCMQAVSGMQSCACMGLCREKARL